MAKSKSQKRPRIAQKKKIELAYKAYELRKKLLLLTGKIGGAHLGGSFSMMEMMVCLYYDFLNIDPQNPKMPERDIFILSKGHAGVGLCTLLADRGFFDESELDHFNQTGSKFGIHPDHKAIPGVEASTGSLGHGLGLALGIALAKKMDRRKERVIALLSDGELCEGSCWEAFLAASHHKIGNLVAIIDFNKMSQDGPLSEIMSLDPLPDKLRSFGWQVLEVDGHDVGKILQTLQKLPAPGHSEKPWAIVMHTVKGKGIPWMENSVTWHYGGFDSEVEQKALEDLQESYQKTILAYQPGTEVPGAGRSGRGLYPDPRYGRDPLRPEGRSLPSLDETVRKSKK